MSKVTRPDTKELMTRVLNEYAKCGVIGLACERAGVHRSRHTKWLKNYPQYKELFETIRERFVDGMEAIAIERAKEKSDSLLMFMLKAHRREVYGDQSKMDMTMSSNSPITLMFAEGMLTDYECKSIIENTIIPNFRNEDYYVGFVMVGGG